MSLLDRGNEDCTVYPEETYTSPDGNVMTRASSNGVAARATFQPVSTGEDDSGGFNTEANYRVRFPRDFPYVLGAQARILWRGVLWSVLGEPRFYGGSPATAHVDYLVGRS